MTALAAVFALLLPALTGERSVLLVQAPDAPVRLDRAALLTPADGPPVLLYAASNAANEEVDQFTVIVFVFAADGSLKATQMAPARRTLEGRSTKYSAIVLDGSPIEPTDSIVIGVNQAQRMGSETWWRVDLRDAAEAAVKQKKP